MNSIGIGGHPSGSGISPPGAGSSNLSNTPTKPSSSDDQEFLEVKSVTLEWKLSSLKHIFDSSKGDTKSKCVKSTFFGEGKWQVFFYPNSGHEQYCSLYLSCQPTAEEFEKGASQLTSPITCSTISQNKTIDPTQVPWHREGLFKFTFEIKSLDRGTTYKTMEANDHAFSHEARNWGWAQYWRRNDAFYSNPSAKYNDAFLICCTIVYSRTPPIAPPVAQGLRKLIPIDLLEAYSSLFNDRLYSDICFKIIRRRPHHHASINVNPLSNSAVDQSDKQNKFLIRRLYASKKILIRRSEYFNTMFDSGFAESSNILMNTDTSDDFYQRDTNLSDRDQSGSSDDDSGDDKLMDEDSDDIDDIEDPEDEEDDDEKEEEEEEEEEEEVGEATTAEDDEIKPVDSVTSLTNQRSEDISRGNPELFIDGDNDLEIFAERSKQETQNTIYSRAESDIHLPGSTSLVTSDEMSEENQVLADCRPLRENRECDDIGQGLLSVVKLDSTKGATSTTIQNQKTLGPTKGLNAVGEEGILAHNKPRTADIRVDNKTNPAKQSRDVCSLHQPRAGETSSSKKVSTASTKKKKKSNQSSRRKMTVIEVTDSAYTTFKALLFFLYTDSITFAPLSSTYHCLKDESLESGTPFNYKSKRDFVTSTVMSKIKISAASSTGMASNPSSLMNRCPVICSAKAIYRLADKLNLTDLKARAFDHITKSLTVQNIPLEVFSSFTSAFEEIRKIEVSYMLSHWNEVRDGRSMKKVLGMLKDGGRIFPGFSEIWGLLLRNLEYKPQPASLCSPNAESNSNSHDQVQRFQQNLTNVGFESGGGTTGGRNQEGIN